MPPAKKQPTRAAGRGAAAAPTPASARREVERSIKRWEKALDDATQALQALARDSGKGAKTAYRDLTKALTALRRDAQKTNRDMLKDLEKLAVAVASGAGIRTTSRASARRATRHARSSAAAARSSASGNAAARTARAPLQKSRLASRTRKATTPSRGS